MAQTAIISSTSADLLSSLAFNALSPHLLATSSLDGHIRIYSRPQSGSSTTHMGNDQSEDAPPAWQEQAAFRAHSGPVLRVRWAEGEWGDLLASCGSDGSARIWDQTLVPMQPPSIMAPSRPEISRRWQQRACLIDAKGSLRDLAFAPAEYGLHLATIGADGFLRLYECPDPSEGYTALPGQPVSQTSGIASWNLLEQIELDKLPHTATSSATAAAASSSAFTNFGMSGISLAGTSLTTAQNATSLTSNAPSTASGSSASAKPGGLLEVDGGWALSFCKDSWYGECLACASGTSGVVRILQFSPPSAWSQVLVLQPGTPSRATPVTSLDWAPGSGRSYQLIAAGYRDGSVRIWKVWPAGGPTGAASLEGWRSELAADLQDHAVGGSVGKVEWNLTGTVLSTAGDDGKVRLWKSSYAGEWRSVAVIACDEEAGSRADELS